MLQDPDARAARPHRQPPRAARWCRRRTWCGATATIPTWWWRPTRAPPPSPTSPTAWRPSTASGSTTPSPPAARSGYDHKKMAITSRGGWESVKRHFRELGKDIQARGLHRRRRRRHVGRRVRQRHADVAAHPPAGGVRPPAHLRRPGPGSPPQLRGAQAALPPAALLLGRLRPGADLRRAAACSSAAPSRSRCRRRWRRCSASRATRLSPAELIQALLKAEVELLWFGGIGTYVKARTESHADVGDRANDALRVDGAELRAKVIGEGANLGMTQRARVEYALQAAGGSTPTSSTTRRASTARTTRSTSRSCSARSSARGS